jgi:hypothetical protein
MLIENRKLLPHFADDRLEMEGSSIVGYRPKAVTATAPYRSFNAGRKPERVGARLRPVRSRFFSLPTRNHFTSTDRLTGALVEEPRSPFNVLQIATLEED